MGHAADLEDDLVASIRHPVTKVMCRGEPPLPTEVAPLARARFAGLADVTVSHPHFLEFVAPGVSKGRAVRWLARRLGVPLGAVLAIGDQWNDIEMLAEVGHGTAMPTAPAEVQAVARYIAPPLAEEGVARMIEALVLAPPARRAGRVRAARRRGDRGRAARDGCPARPSRRDRADRARRRRRVAAEAIEVLRGGGVVALPTDTVYGIAVALETPGGVERLFEVKRRPPDKGIMLLLADAAQAPTIGVMRPAADGARRGLLAGRTDRRRRRSGRTSPLPAALTGGAPTIGLRVPDHDAPRALAAWRRARCRRRRPTSPGSRRRATPARSSPSSATPSTSSSTAVPAHGGPASTVVDCTGERRGSCASARSRSSAWRRSSTPPASPTTGRDRSG